ncbi:mitochondrial ribosome and complex I assembly factor AltMIEF1-like [Lasioglossum baleicum]|uniref:mitochondrial ribosome and complex I assembly factor AltMIEF1-like n=1 Tax=Lasioglossum baleicum TaxID=434251 RepID=UPI003FCCF36C
MRLMVLRLYKDLLRYGGNLKYTDKLYFRARIRHGFRENKQLTDEHEINFQFQKGQKLLSDQRVV